MSKCDFCNKKVCFGIKVSHSHRRSNRTWKPNIRKARVLINGIKKRFNVCSGCIRSGKLEN
ncbi:MAG: 50S ribosomal protein L28 [Candidatus Improbicoccus pseudotrichonymphae]|uniref:Large ribosomal subunit protein bL28 n=1 Tax=Candidatus Improbicoccus pseudotrichonymphae TaxID=3033792 RepID=A0AA48KYX5_9FIRM|nr:MAG: 50S ribosomal protein L28 [Candidatus Improbicoccus pseudotrichonymphae]